MDLATKLAILKQIYSIYDDFAGNLNLACKKYCAQCCTNNVTMTSLEGYFIAETIVKKEQSHLFEMVKTAASKKRFQPRITTNKIAELCIKGKDLPEEDYSTHKGNCPFLKAAECPIYSIRPFGCRCLVSNHDCREKGYAEVDPFVLTVNNLFLQFIEHVDFQGFSGNLIDVLILTASKEKRHSYKMNKLRNPATGLVPNMQIKVLMIPPEHRVKVKPILNALQNIKMPVS
jgi:Fe-S-cluster containining protein